MTIEQALENLNKSVFRAKFHLSPSEKDYVRQKGEAVIRSHAADFIRQRLAEATPQNDGKQTPLHGHPVFVAQHACACCCRGCLAKWYHVPKGVALTETQQQKIVNLLWAWIARQTDEK